MLAEKAAESRCKFRRTLRLALPNDQAVPALTAQASKHLSVSRGVRCDLRSPEFRVRLWLLQAVLAAVVMPEATVDENYLALAREYEIRFSG